MFSLNPENLSIIYFHWFLFEDKSQISSLYHENLSGGGIIKRLKISLNWTRVPAFILFSNYCPHVLKYTFSVRMSYFCVVNKAC